MRRELAGLDGPPNLTDCLQGGVRGCEGDLGGDGLPCKPLASVGCCDLSFHCPPDKRRNISFPLSSPELVFPCHASPLHPFNLLRSHFSSNFPRSRPPSDTDVQSTILRYKGSN